MTLAGWKEIHAHILAFEEEGLVTRTFRRLDPERQQAILTAILDEAIDKGPTSLNIKEVARRANVSIGSLYTYFGNREGLLNFTIKLCAHFMEDTFNGYQPYFENLSLSEALAAYLVGGLEWGQTQMGLVRFFARAAYHSDSDLSEQVVRPVAAIMRKMVQSILQQAAGRGEVRPDVDLEATTRIIHALMIVIGDSQLLPYLNTYFQVTDEEMPAERIIEALIEFILAGIGTKE